MAKLLAKAYYSLSTIAKGRQVINQWISSRCTISRLSKAQVVAPIVLCAGLTACVTVPPVANQTAPEADPFTPETIQKIRSEAGAKGWISQVDIRSNGRMSLIFVKPQSLTRVGNYARISKLVVLDAPLRLNNTLAMSSIQTVQFDCINRVSQILSTDTFQDRDARVKIGSSIKPSEPLPVPVGSVHDLLLQRSCSNSYNSAQAQARIGNSSGTGILVAGSSVITNQHVVATCGSIDVIFDGKRHPATVKRRDTKNDLALLNVPTLPQAIYPPLRNKASAGEGVMVAGYPLSGLLSSDMIVTDGIVNALSGIGNDPSQMQISAPVQPGNSGGPVIDKSGALVGVVVSKFNALRAASVTGDIAQNINFAIKPEVLRLFLEAENVVVVSTDSKTRLESDILAQKARGFTAKIECKSQELKIAAPQSAT